jgi:hypothetical protein
MILIGLVTLLTKGYTQLPYKRFAIENWCGISQPQTDPTPAITPFYGINLRYSLSPLLALNLNYGLGTWKNGNDNIGRTFTTPYYLFGFRGQVNLGELFHFYHLTHRVHPYLGLGLYRIQFTVSGIRQREKDALVAKDYRGGLIGMPISFGIRFYISPRLDAFVSAEYVLHNSDSVDGHSVDTRFYNSLNNPDYLLFISTGISWKFGLKKQKGQTHMEWTSPAEEAQAVFQQVQNKELEAGKKIDSIGKILEKQFYYQNKTDSVLNQLQNRIQSLENRPLAVDTKGRVDTTSSVLLKQLQKDNDYLTSEVKALNEKINYFLLGYIPKYGKVTLTQETELRLGLPNTQAKVIKKLPKGSILEYTGFVTKGELMNGNPSWYKDAGGNYFSAGATNNPNPTEK